MLQRELLHKGHFSKVGHKTMWRVNSEPALLALDLAAVLHPDIAVIVLAKAESAEQF